MYDFTCKREGDPNASRVRVSSPKAYHVDLSIDFPWSRGIDVDWRPLTNRHFTSGFNLRTLADRYGIVDVHRLFITVSRR